MVKNILLGFGLASVVTSQAQAVTSINLDFNGSGSTLAATGFDDVINENNNFYNVAGGVLTLTTLDGDMFGRFEPGIAGDPDTDAKNIFSSEIDVLDRTVLEAKVSVVGLNANFHGGGLWMGVDTDHYARLGIVHNDFELDGPIRIEFLRENEDLWDQAVPAGPGTHILGEQIGIGGDSPLVTPLSVVLRIERDGNTVHGFYSLDDGATFSEVGTGYDNLSLPGDPQGAGSNTLETNALHVGVYAYGGLPFDTPADVSFDTFVAEALMNTGLDGDLNDDGFVGIADLNIVLGAWNQNVPPADSRSDPSGDGFVGIADLNVVLGNWNAGSPPLSAVIPEPASAMLVAVGGLALSRRLR